MRTPSRGALTALTALTVLVVACSGEPTVMGAATLVELEGSGVTGRSTLSWDPNTQVLTINTHLEGVEEGVRYVTIISPGCEPHNGLIYQAGTADGEADGTASIKVDVANVDGVDLQRGWGLKVVRPPIGEAACGEIGPG